MSSIRPPNVDVTQDDEDGYCFTSEIPLPLPASENVAFHNVALVTFAQAEGDLIQNVQESPSDTVSDRVKSLAITASQYALSRFSSTSFLKVKQMFNW